MRATAFAGRGSGGRLNERGVPALCCFIFLCCGKMCSVCLFFFAVGVLSRFGHSHLRSPQLQHSWSAPRACEASRECGTPRAKDTAKGIIYEDRVVLICPLCHSPVFTSTLAWSLRPQGTASFFPGIGGETAAPLYTKKTCVNRW